MELDRTASTRWFLEPAGGASNRFYLRMAVSGQKQRLACQQMVWLHGCDVVAASCGGNKLWWRKQG